MTAPDPDITPADLGRFEPSPYDLGITDDPEAAWNDGRSAGSGVPVAGLTAPGGGPVFLGAGGRLVYDAEPESADGCFAGYPGPEHPVPYTLTPAAEAALDDPDARGPYPGSGDPERLARWCGFPAMAAMEAACEADAREQAAQSAMEARWEAEAIAEAEAAEDPEAEPWP